MAQAATQLSDIHELMREHDREHAPGSESAQWGAFVEDCVQNFGLVPWDDRAFDVDVTGDFAAYWTAVADRDYEKAGEYGEVSKDWVSAPDPGDLHDYETGDRIRGASPEEHAASIESSRTDGGAGVIEIDGRSCYVQS